MHKILILSHTRMGDIVQMTSFLKRLKSRYPESLIHMLTEECFAPVASLAPAIDRIITMNMQDLLPPLSSAHQVRLAGATKAYREIVNSLADEGYDLVWNFTHTKPSAVLAYLISEGRAHGVTLDPSGLQRVNSPWLRYFFATNLARPWCQFNLVDIYANCVRGIPWTEHRNVLLQTPRRAYDRKQNTGPDARHIAIHPGASQAAKQWPTVYFVNLCSELVKHGVGKITIIGGPRDQALAAAFAGLPCVELLIGRTSPNELVDHLDHCDLLISNDSGPMHIAAAVGTPVIAITVGTALGYETAPYGLGNFVIEPSGACFPCAPSNPCMSDRCARSVSVGEVMSLVALKLGLNPENTISVSQITSRVYETQFSTTDGMLELFRLNPQSGDDRDSIQTVMRAVWMSILEGRGMSPRPDAILDDKLTRAASRAAELFRRAVGYYSILADSCANNSVREQRLEIAELIRRNDLRIAEQCSSHGPLLSLWNYYELGKVSLNSTSLWALAKESETLAHVLTLAMQAMAGTADLQLQKHLSHHHVMET